MGKWLTHPEEWLCVTGSSPVLASNEINKNNASTCMFTNGNMDRDAHLLFNNPGILQGTKKITPE